MAERKAEKAAAEDSFQSVATLWLEHWQDGKSPRHVAYVKRRMDTDILPCLGARPVAAIEAPELVGMTKAIEERGARDIAKRALETTGQVFRYAIAHGYARRNPASEIRPGDVLKSIRKVNYARVDARELPSLLRAMEVYQGTHVTRLAMKLLALTFVRTSELIGARWAEFDFDAAGWNIPAERMKMRTPHIVPLAKQALDALDTLRTLSRESEWLFPGDRNANKPMSNNTILKALERMGFKGRMTGHGFRGLASTILHEQGYAHDHIELQLAHAPRNAVSAAYNHALYLEPRAKMMRDWAEYLERTQRGGKVLPFRGSAAWCKLITDPPEGLHLQARSLLTTASAKSSTPGWIDCLSISIPRIISPWRSVGIQNRPDLQSLKFKEEAGQKFSKAQHEQLLPTINALGVVGETPVGSSQYFISNWYGAVGGNVSVLIFNGFRFTAQASEAALQAQAANQQTKALREQIARDVRTAWLNANTALQRETVTGELVKEANAAMDLAKTRYDLGLSSIVELSQAELQQTEAAIDNANARSQYEFAMATISYQTGVQP
jgi:integrase